MKLNDIIDPRNDISRGLFELFGNEFPTAYETTITRILQDKSSIIEQCLMKEKTEAYFLSASENIENYHNDNSIRLFFLFVFNIWAICQHYEIASLSKKDIKTKTLFITINKIMEEVGAHKYGDMAKFQVEEFEKKELPFLKEERIISIAEIRAQKLITNDIANIEKLKNENILLKDTQKKLQDELEKIERKVTSMTGKLNDAMLSAGYLYFAKKLRAAKWFQRTALFILICCAIGLPGTIMLAAFTGSPGNLSTYIANNDIYQKIPLFSGAIAIEILLLFYTRVCFNNLDKITQMIWQIHGKTAVMTYLTENNEKVDIENRNSVVTQEIINLTRTPIEAREHKSIDPLQNIHELINTITRALPIKK